MIVVGDGIRDIDELCLETRLATIQEPLTKVPEFARIAFGAMLEDAFTCLPGQVQPREIGVLCIPGIWFKVILASVNSTPFSCVMPLLPNSDNKK